jgi:hypothetical protein
MNRIGKSILIIALIAGCSLQASFALAGACTSIASGPWSTAATWGAGCTGPLGIPSASDNVTIGATTLVTVTAPAFSNTINILASTASPGPNGIAIIGANTLTNALDFQMVGGVAAANASEVDVGSGTLKSGGMAIKATGAGTSTVGVGAGGLINLNANANITLTGGAAATAIALVTVSTGTINASSINFAGTAATAKFSSTGASIVNLTGNFGSGGTLTTGNTGIINFDGAAAQTIGAYATYNNISINNTAGGVSFSGAATVNGSLLVNTGALTSPTNGAKILVGPVTVNAGGSFGNAGNAALTFEGGITHNGTSFSTGSGATSFTTNNQIIAGSSPMNFGTAAAGGGISITGAISVTNNNTSSITVATDLNGSVAGSTWIQGMNSTLNIGGTLLFTGTLNASAAPNTVNYTAGFGNSTRIVKLANASSYYNLMLTGATTKAIGSAAGQTLTVQSNLTIGVGSGFNASTTAIPTGSAAGFNPNVVVNGTLDNFGTLTPGTGTYNIGTFINESAGSYTAGSGNVTVTGSLTNNAALPAKFSTGTGTFAIGGNLSNTGTFVTSTGPVNLAGSFANSGTFSSGNGLFTFNGATAQTFSGNSITINLVALNNPAGLTLAANLTAGASPPAPPPGSCTVNAVAAATVLTLTQGQITTGPNVLAINNGSAIAGAGVTTGGVTAFVNGNLQKSFTLAKNETRVFEVGSGSTYAPITFNLGCINSTGTLTVATFGSDSPQINSSNIDPIYNVNRYWTVALSPAAANWNPRAATDTVMLQYGPGDIATNAVPGLFAVAYYSGSAWTTLTTAPTCPTSICATSLQASVAGQYQIGDPLGTVGAPFAFNAYEHSTLPATAASGFLQTKIAADAIPGAINSQFDIAALSSATTMLTTFTGTVQVDLLGSTTTGTPVTSACPAGFAALMGAPVNVIFANSGRVAAALPAIANVWRDVRVRITYVGPTSTVTSCATDNFAIRPYGLLAVASDADWTTPGTVRPLANMVVPGGNVHKAGQPFTLTATAQNYAGTATSQYAGSPTFAAGSPTCVLPACGVGLPGVLGTLSLGAAPPFWSASSGVVTDNTVTYSDVGAISLLLEDRTFASVDSGDGSAYVIPQLNGSSFGAINVGRIVPDHLDATATSNPVFATACPAGLYTYVGQNFNYSTAPVVTVTARNASNGATLNYNGTGLVTLTNASLAQGLYAAQSGRYNSLDVLAPPAGATPALDTSGLPGIGADPTISAFANGVGTLTFSGGLNGLDFTRSPTSPSRPFAASIALALNIVDLDAVAYTANPFSFTPQPQTALNGIAFSGGNNFYYGRMHAQNANGSELLQLAVTVNTQYFNGFGFITNTFDQCTPLIAANVGRGNFQFNLTAAQATPVVATATFVKGVNTVTFSAPGAGKNGAMDFVIDLGTVAPNVPVTCAGIPGPVAGNNYSFLRDIQSCSGGAYNRDPTAHVTFGTNNINNKSIYLRENY